MGLIIPDRRENPFLLPMAKASGNKKEVEGWQVHGIKKTDRFDPEKLKSL